MPSLPIAAAARLCGCPRSTLQRAIRAGRLHLDSQHQLDTDELTSAGYLHAAGARQSQAPASPQPRSMLEEMLRDMQRTMERLTETLERLMQALMQQPPRSMAHATGAPQQRDMPQESPQEAPGDTQPGGAQEGMQQGGNAEAGYDATRYILGKLCRRGHDYQGTGQTLRRIHNRDCPKCGALQKQAARRKR